MTKMQIVAKTALTVLGIHAIVLLLRQTDYIIRMVSWWQQIVYYLLLISIVITIARLLIFKNDSIACRITGQDEILPAGRAASFLACNYRIALVFYGLILLLSSTRQLNLLIMLFNPASIRKWINNTIYGGFDFVEFFDNAIEILPQMFIVSLTIYLIVGAPHFVRSQADRMFCKTCQPIIEEK